MVRKPVEVVRYVYVRVDASLTVPCPIAMPRNDSVGELLRVARERRASLEACNARIKAIRDIEGTPIDPQDQARFVREVIDAIMERP